MTQDDELPKLVNNNTKPPKKEKERPKEIPIAARVKGPGPAAYTLPPTVGSQATVSKGQRAPAYSFGVKITSSKADHIPGPNEFFPHTTRNGLTKGPAFSLQGGFKKGEKGFQEWAIQGTDTPGPGKYYPKVIPSKEPKAPAYSISPRRPLSLENKTPGPAQYEVNTTLGLHPVVTVHTAPAYSIKPQRPLKLEHVSPGPAAYSPIQPSKVKKTSPAYSLGARLVKEPFKKGPKSKEGDKSPKANDELPTPGPGQYSPKLRFVRDNIPRFSFRCKHSEYELFVPDTVDGEFSF